ncbi:MAG: alpha/beta hydrolase [Actinobacteria bacterium]|nr:alpha/beta hydrolase [Actinomycetota bacterium]MBV8481149.1 alpha/beta hydrolase [Actinomycetota bacterium]MBV8597441.1 alpha/beta hydrolase [Actinomycetota bacterium]
MQSPALFLPGWGAPATLYEPGLPPEWRALEPPSFAASGGSLAAYSRWLDVELHHRGRSRLGGHSMGAALAILAAAESPELVERLVLVAPAGLPLQKPIAASIVDFLRQVARGVYPRDAATRALAAVARAPRAAWALAEQVRALDLRRECARIREAGIPVLVVGCASDTLVTRRHSRALADALGADYRELASTGGHMWMLGEHDTLARVLA